MKGWMHVCLPAVCCALCLPIVTPSPAHAQADDPLRFQVTIPEEVHPEEFTGRILIHFAPWDEPEPRFGAPLDDLQPVLAVDVEDHPPEEPVVLDVEELSRPEAKAFPEPLGDWQPDEWYVQAVADRHDRVRRQAAEQSGNLHSTLQQHTIDPESSGTIELELSEVVEEPTPPEDTEWVEKVEVRSSLLSDFHGRDVHLRAGVILPPGYHNEDRSYPAVYVAPGFGGRHTGAWGWIEGEDGERWRAGDFPMPMLRIVLDPDMRHGNSTFANSETNGPVGDALVQELIPAIEEEYRVEASSDARFVKGHSSGGWASLWLQVTYPDVFGGTWSTGPDPVDFSYFQIIDIHEHDNAYWDAHGYPRPSMRVEDEIVLTIREENRYEYVTGPGGQWISWFSVFSPADDDGSPVPLWDPLTGEIDREVAEEWRDYDIRHQLETRWDELEEDLRGKLHVIGGAEDNFYLELALRNLKEAMEDRDHGGYIEIHPGDHGSFRTPELMERIYREMRERYEEVSN